MKKTVFISYHFNDKTYKGEIQKWLEDAGVRVLSVDEKDLRPEGDNAIKNSIRDQIAQSNAVLVLVGNDTHKRPWVDYEVAVTRSQQVPIYWIRLSNRTGAAPVELRNITPIDFSRTAILRQVCN